MTFLERWRSPRLTFLQTLVSLVLGALALTSPYWCEGKQKVPKPLCSPIKSSNCIPVPGVSNSVSVQFSWETGDDRFVFPAFHAGLFFSCEENIYTDAGEEKCRGFHTLTPSSERGMLWLSVVMEIMYVGLLCISCVLLSLQLCLSLWCPSAQRWGQLLNSFAAVFTVLGGLLGMVAHMMFMSVFQTTASMGPEDFKPHSYGYSWAFYVAWVAFTCCMSAGVSTLNNYTKRVIMVGPRCNYDLNPCGLDYMRPQFPPAPYYTLPHPQPPLPESSHQLSPLSPYYGPPSPPSPRSLPLPRAELFPPHPSRPAPPSPYHRHSVPSPSVPSSPYHRNSVPSPSVTSPFVTLSPYHRNSVPSPSVTSLPVTSPSVTVSPYHRHSVPSPSLTSPSVTSSPYHRHSVPSPSVPSPSVSLRLHLPAQSYGPPQYWPEEEYSPL